MLSLKQMERRIIQFWLLVGDGIGLFTAFLIAQSIRFNSGDLWLYSTELFHKGRFFIVYLVFIFSHYIFDLYEPRHWRSSLFSPLKIIFASGTAALLLSAWFYFLAMPREGVYGRGVLLGSIAGFTFFSLCFRFYVDYAERQRKKNLEWLLIGGARIFETLQKDWERLDVGGRLVWQDREKMSDEVNPLEALLKKPWAGIVIDGVLTERATRALMTARLKGQIIFNLQNFYEFYCGKVQVRGLDDSWFAFTEGFSIIHSQTSNRLKRATDVFISIVMLTILSPLLLLLTVLIRLESRGAALYSQVRVGQFGRTFIMWKFRSMRQNAEAKSGPQWAEKNDSRVTRLGKLMRKMRLDELPQLWNILKGEMSFIGPRPERPEFTEELRKKIPFYDFRHLVKPGLTGWAQVMYPYGASEEDALEKLQFDLFYIKNYSFTRDIEISLKTISVVLFGAGR